MSKHDLKARPIYQHKRESIDAHLTIVFAALAISRWIEDRAGWSIKKFVKTARRYRTVQIRAGSHLLTAEDPLPNDLRAALDRIHDGPLVATNHGPFTTQSRRIYMEAAKHAWIVAISHAQARSSGGIPIAAVIHHGIDLDLYRPGPGDGGYLLFMGRMCASKGVHVAVRVAKRSGWRLVLVTKIWEEDERAYFDHDVRPLLEPGDEMPAEQPLARRVQLLRGAHALLNPIQWPEPFGLVMAEALASGTPVLAFPNGSAPEIVESGRTGYLCKDEDEMVAAIEAVGTIKRADCRSAAERRFSLARMARDHERLYRRLLEERDPRPNDPLKVGDRSLSA